MKKIIYIILFIFSLLFPFGALGQPRYIDQSRNMLQLWNGLITLSNWLFSFLVVAGVIGVVVSGYMFVSSGGDANKAASARQMLLYSLVGVLVASFAWALITFVS